MKAFVSLVILLICLIFDTNSAYAQDLLAKGVIIEKGTNIRIALCVVTNRRTKQAVGSNDLGMYQIKAKLGDTLFIEKRNFVDQQIVVRDDKDVIAYLIRASTTLEEVTIKGKTKKEDLDEIRREFKRQGSFYEGKPPLILLNPFSGSPLTFFYELFGKTPAKARRFKKYYDNEIKSMQVDLFFNKTLINKYTNFEGKNLDKFMLDYYPKSEMVKNWNNYDAVNYIKVSAKKYTDTLKN
ncbi:hypothetical protein H7U22_00215 [Pedobacter sp. CCM 8938]|uniref:CarboxypepD_reg-like domain-containing protein n=1 Tax=Pedobacter fastidiosus TaxID=2765361 RepID=A0ABR7KM72_9SPHI|nr:hypothetical protein [Pedobacter fastidiosus]MBC6108833.1 hypothetical protein [Pedobacter fastidiosus]